MDNKDTRLCICVLVAVVTISILSWGFTKNYYERRIHKFPTGKLGKVTNTYYNKNGCVVEVEVNVHQCHSIDLLITETTSWKVGGIDCDECRLAMHQDTPVNTSQWSIDWSSKTKLAPKTVKVRIQFNPIIKNPEELKPKIFIVSYCCITEDI